MLQIALCDDNINELSNMSRLIGDYRADRHLMCEYSAFHNGFELLSVLEKGRRFDIYCLDILMPAFTGIDVAKEIRAIDQNASILFFTSSTEFALESYSVNAIHYVLKPINAEKLYLALDKVLDRIQIEQDDAIVVKSSEGIQKILLSGLVYAEVIGRNVFYHLRSGKVVECTEPFAPLCDMLIKNGNYVRPHRSYIVNMQYIDTIGNQKVTLQTLSSVPIAQGKAREIKEQYLRFQMEEE